MRIFDNPCFQSIHDENRMESSRLSVVLTVEYQALHNPAVSNLKRNTH
jgi:hypothetical protein